MSITTIKAIMLVKDVNVKSLVTGDKSCRIVLEVLNPDDITKLKELADIMEVAVSFTYAPIEKETQQSPTQTK